jgi:hypothetical protein
LPSWLPPSVPAALFSRRSPALWLWLGRALILIVALVILTTFRSYGMTWDEPVYKEYGDRILRWYTSGFHDKGAREMGFLSVYGGFFDTLTQALVKISFLDTYTTRHLVNAGYGLLAIIYTWRLGTLLRGPKAGFVAALFLCLTPMFYGHMYNNPRDVPFAALYVVSLFYIVRCAKMLPRVPWLELLKLGIAIGLALGGRIGAVFLLFLWGACVAGFLLAGIARRDKQTRGRLRRDAARVGAGFAYVTVIAWAIMLVFWPWGQAHPLSSWWESMKMMSQFPWKGTILFRGREIASEQLPRSYVPTFLTMILPEFYFLALGAGGALVLARYVFAARRPGLVSRWPYLLLAFACVWPPVVAIVLHSTLYDGIRHFMFILPPLAILAGISLTALLESAAPALLKGGVLVGVLAAAAVTLVDMIQLHPYQSLYFNRTVAGGLPGAASQFETDYWGITYQEGAQWVIRNYAPGYPGRIRVATFPVDVFAHHYFDEDPRIHAHFLAVKHEELPNVYLSMTRSDGHKWYSGKVLHVVQRQGVPLMYVIETCPLEPAPLGATVTPAQGPLPESACKALITAVEPLSPAAPHLVVARNAAMKMHVRIENAGDKAWPAMEASPDRDLRVTVGNHWLSADGQMRQHDDGRGYLAYDLPPGQSQTVTAQVHAPAQPGDYILEMDVLQEGVAWFGDRTGSPTLRIPVHVQ